jgi:hypothetical protein
MPGHSVEPLIFLLRRPQNQARIAVRRIILPRMLDLELTRAVAENLMSRDQFEVGGQKLRVRRTSSQRLRNVAFTMNGREYQAIEQNPEKPSRWGKLAQAGHKVVQFKDAESNRYVAVAVDGEVKEYGRLGKTRP